MNAPTQSSVRRFLPSLLALTAALLTAFAVLPGCLGVLKFTYRFAATPAGAWFMYVGAIPLHIVATIMLTVALIMARRSGAPWLVPGLATASYVGVSVFGFFMHTGFMFRPVALPDYVTLDAAIARFGPKETVVGVLDSRGMPYAYVARLARRPHIVQQPEGPVPFMMSHCILANSSMAYAVEPGTPPPRISISSVIANNLVFYDHDRHNTVQQIYNCAIDGRDRLPVLSTVTTSLAAWRSLYPDSRVWVRPLEWRDAFYLKFLARGSVIDPSSPDLVYPLQRPADPRLPLKSSVMGLQFGDAARAYPAAVLARDRVTQEEIGGQPVVFLASEDGEFVQLFSRRRPDGQGVLRFKLAPNGGHFLDEETGSIWDAAGRCSAGPLRDVQLAAIPHYSRIFWCVWADFFPHTSVFGPTR